jgi:hypothetical protein
MPEQASGEGKAKAPDKRRVLVRIDLSRKERWTKLIGDFEILHDPVSATIMLEAGEAAKATVEVADGQVADLHPTIEQKTTFITKFVARSVIRDWRGVVDDATGKPIPVTPDAIDRVFDLFPVFRAFNAKVIDARMRIEREKKSSPILPNGTSDPGGFTAPTAGSDAPTVPEH